MVVQRSALSPTAPKIRVQIPLATKCSLLYEKTKINENEAGVGPFKKNTKSGEDLSAALELPKRAFKAD